MEVGCKLVADNDALYNDILNTRRLVNYFCHGGYLERQAAHMPLKMAASPSLEGCCGFHCTDSKDMACDSYGVSLVSIL